MRTVLRVVLICTFVSATVAFAQSKSPQGPFSTFNRAAYGQTQANILHSAEKMPEQNFNFKPVDSVRTYGQILGHIADSQYYFCSTASGEKAPTVSIEKTKTSKADLVAALKDAFTYCDKVYETMTDTAGAQTVKMFGSMETPKLDVLVVNLMHNNEHYGNLVTYMRMKNIVPPTSEQQSAPPPKK